MPASNKETYSLLMKGFKSKKEAQAFLDWYEGQGEQSADVWYEIHENVVPMVNHDVKQKWNGNTLEFEIKT